MENSEIVLKYIDSHNGTAYQIAKSTGISESTISKWRKNPTSKIDVSVIQKIAAFYGITTSDLLDENQAGSVASISNDEEHLLEYYNELDDLDKRSILGKAEGLAEAARRRKSELEAAAKEKSKPKPKPAPLPEPDLPKKTEAEYDNEEEDEDDYIYLDFPDLPVSAGTGVYLHDDHAEQIKVPANSKTLRANYALKVDGDSMEPCFHSGDIVLVETQPSVEVGEVGIFIYEGEAYLKEFGGDRLISLNPKYEDKIITDFDSFYCKGRVFAKLK